MVLNRDFVLLVGVTVLEVILFQQVFVNLMTDINHLQVIQEYIAQLKITGKNQENELDETKFSEKTGLASYILNFSSAFNFCLSFIYILCVYIAINQTSQAQDKQRSFSKFCGDFALLSRFVFLWYVFKMFFSFSLLFVLLLGTNMSFAEGGSVLFILAASFGKVYKLSTLNYLYIFSVFLCLNQKMSEDLSMLAMDHHDDTKDILYEPLSTEDQVKIV